MDESVLGSLLSVLSREQALVDEAAGKERRRTVGQAEYAAQLSRIRGDIVAALREPQARIGAAGYDSRIDDKEARVPGNTKQRDHVVTWTFGPTGPFVPPFATVTVAAEPNDDATGGEVVICFTRTTALSEEDAAIVRSRKFVSVTLGIAETALMALREVDQIAAAIEPVVGPVDRQVVAAVLGEASRLMDLYFAVSLEGKAEFGRRNVFRYDSAAIDQDINDLVRLLLA